MGDTPDPRPALEQFSAWTSTEGLVKAWHLCRQILLERHTELDGGLKVLHGEVAADEPLLATVLSGARYDDKHKRLGEDEENARWIAVYARDQDAFFKDFAASFLKLSNQGATFV